MLTIETELHRVETVAFSPCGQFIAAGGIGVELWSLGLERVWRWGWDKQAGTGNCYVVRVEFHPLDDCVFALDNVGTFHQLQVADAAARRFRPLIFPFNSFGISRTDGRVFLSGRGELNCWNGPPPAAEFGARGELWNELFRTGSTEINCLTSLLDGSVLNQELRADGAHFVIRDPASGSSVKVLPCSIRGMKAIALSTCGRFLASSHQNTLRVWSLEHLHRPPRVLANDTKKAITGFAFHPGGRFLATASNDRGVKLWDLQTWRPTATFDWREGRMRSIAFSPDGLVAAAGSDTGQLVLFDVDL